MSSRMLLVTSIVTGVASISVFARPPYSAWSAPVNLGALINSPFTETGVALSKHDGSLYIASNRPCDQYDAVADFNLWVARRSSADVPWEEPHCLRINADARAAGDAPFQDREPGLSRWSSPVNLGPSVNSSVTDQEPEISPDRRTLFFASNRPGSIPTPTGAPSLDIWMATRTWGTEKQ